MLCVYEFISAGLCLCVDGISAANAEQNATPTGPLLPHAHRLTGAAGVSAKARSANCFVVGRSQMPLSAHMHNRTTQPIFRITADTALAQRSDGVRAMECLPTTHSL